MFTATDVRTPTYHIDPEELARLDRMDALMDVYCDPYATVEEMAEAELGVSAAARALLTDLPARPGTIR